MFQSPIDALYISQYSVLVVHPILPRYIDQASLSFIAIKLYFSQHYYKKKLVQGRIIINI